MLKEVIQDRWKQALKEKDENLKNAFGMIKAKILLEEKSGKHELPLSDSIVESLIQKEVKELRETQSYYKEENKEYQDIKEKISALSEFFPIQLSSEEVKEIIKRVQTYETNKGKLIGLVIKEVGSRFDKSKISALVAEVMK